MRTLAHGFLCGVVVAVLAAARPSAQVSLDVPVRAGIRVAALDPARPCDLWRTVEHVARFTGVRVGFEHTANCWPAGQERRAYGPSIALAGLTPRMVFDQIVRARPEFAWREIDGVVVVRPLAAWQDSTHLLHRPVTPFAVARMHPHLVLHRAAQAARPSLVLEHDEVGPLSVLGRRLDDPAATGRIDLPIDVEFAGGTVLQALNAVTRPFGGNWELGYGGRPFFTVYTPDFDEGFTSLPLAAPAKGTTGR